MRYADSHKHEWWQDFAAAVAAAAAKAIFGRYTRTETRDGSAAGRLLAIWVRAGGRVRTTIPVWAAAACYARVQGTSRSEGIYTFVDACFVSCFIPKIPQLKECVLVVFVVGEIW
jgi:hypothetical protein